MSTRKIGESTLVSVNNLPAMLRKMAAARIRATQAMAEEAKHQAQLVFYSDGDGTWPENSDSTIEWKGHDKVMRGRTSTLSENIQILTSETLGMKSVGWFDVDHPDSKLSQAGLAWVHELGLGGVPERPWLSKVHDNPQHADAVYAIGAAAYKVF